MEPFRRKVTRQRYPERPGRRAQEYPRITLDGAWLRDVCGIDVGDEIEVKARKGGFTVKKK